MIKRFENTIVFICDECGDELETDEEAWGFALEKLRDEDWHFEQEAQGYVHTCPLCRP